MAKSKSNPRHTYWELFVSFPGKEAEYRIQFIFIDSTGFDLFEKWPTDHAIDVLSDVTDVELQACKMWLFDRPRFDSGVYYCKIHASTEGALIALREQEQTAFSPGGNIDKPSQILGRIAPMILFRCRLLSVSPSPANTVVLHIPSIDEFIDKASPEAARQLLREIVAVADIARGAAGKDGIAH